MVCYRDLTTASSYLALDNFCCAVAENKLVSRITHKTLVQLDLWNMRLTPATAAAVGRLLPEMSLVKWEEVEHRTSGGNRGSI